MGILGEKRWGYGDWGPPHHDTVIIGRNGGFLVQKTANLWRILVQKRYKHDEILEYFLGPEISKRTKVGNVSGRYNRNRKI